MELLDHINLREPLLGGGALIVAPVKTLVPRNARAAEGIATWRSYGAPKQGLVEHVYLMELLADDRGQTRALHRRQNARVVTAEVADADDRDAHRIWSHESLARRRPPITMDATFADAKRCSPSNTSVLPASTDNAEAPAARIAWIVARPITGT